MNDPEPIYTPTMASIYARQGHIREAIDIYRHLLKQQPDCREFIDAIAELEARRQPADLCPLSNVVPLLSEWIDLLLRYATLRKLKHLRQIDRETDTPADLSSIDAELN